MAIKPLISICIATYNRPKILSKLLDRLLRQIDNNLRDKVEIVIANNNKTSDETDAAVYPYIQKNQNIHYFNNKDIIGFYNTVKTTEYAKGEYIIILADDDCLTDFALPYIVQIIEKTKFDILIHKPFFSENIDTLVPQDLNKWRELSGVNEYIDYLHTYEKAYKHLISFFSFGSALIVKASYRFDSIGRIDQTFLKQNNFPHELPAYYDLKDKIVVVPQSFLVIGRILNESYPSNTLLVHDFCQVMDYIEFQNDLKFSKKRQEIKRMCVHGRSRNIILGIWIKKLGLDYKTNGLLKRVYYLYKKFVQ